ncbi:energy transducer TonB [Commensalibacter nepenthis]|uniref:Energy transducer TonB n=1 Tax=Commensalibacter nepenthis TaxID=3043872 RepID=A0ABT6Q570_9PROT|nr:energy transducer TonB [Commensalibacter sp. TBRC 10068]MDI2112048.1 energy transducer TonB [Commensalibacter sp. TBRC 10068]
MSELYHLLQMFFSALLFLLSCLGSLGQFLYPWANKTEQKLPKANIEAITRAAGNRPVNGVQLEYPKDMLDARKQGRVILFCDVEVTGKPVDCEITQTSGHKAFDVAALRYMMQALFDPAMEEGVPVREYKHRYVVDFRLGQ